MNFTEAKGRSGLTVGDKAKAGMPLFKAVRFFIRLLGPNIAFFLGKVVGIIAARFTPRELRVVAAQLAYAQNQTDSLKNLTPQKLLTENYIHLSRSFVELYFFDVFLEKAKIDETNAANRHYPRLKCIEAVGLEECRELARSNQGALFLSAHIGNFELLAAYHILGGLTVTILGKEPNYEILKKLGPRY